MGVAELCHDLRRTQLAAEPEEPGGAEATAECAADLRGQAQRDASGRWYEDRFHLLAVIQAPQGLHGSVGRLRDKGGFRRIQRISGVEFRSQRLGDVRHPGEPCGISVEHPISHLGRAIGRLPGPAHKSVQRQVDFARRQAQDFSSVVISRRRRGLLFVQDGLLGFPSASGFACWRRSARVS